MIIYSNVNKRIWIILCLTVSVSFLSIIINKVIHNTSSETIKESESIIFTTTDLIESTLGYLLETQTDNVHYLFSTEGELSVKLRLIQEIETVLVNFRERFPLLGNDKLIKVYFDSGGAPNKLHTNFSQLVINETVSSNGAIISYLIDFKLPAWLCAGMENYFSGRSTANHEMLPEWLKESEVAGLPGFGDVWFIPQMINDEDLRKKAMEASGLFVAYLDREKDLENLLNLYRTEEKKADERFREQWKSFIGSELADVDLRYSYSYGVEGFLFEAQTQRTNVQFMDNDWNYQDISEYVEYIEESTAYVENWLGYRADSPLTYQIYPQIKQGASDLAGIAYPR